MKMLIMPSELRRRLSSQNAMAINAKGQEVLYGLTLSESRFMVDCCGRSANDMSEEERGRYADLVLKHEHARMRSASANSGIAKDEQCLG